MNGKAVAIECFLDITAPAAPNPTVRWTSYNASLNTYQGELLQKDEYIRLFLEAVGRRSSYDYSKLSMLWQGLIASCITPRIS